MLHAHNIQLAVGVLAALQIPFDAKIGQEVRTLQGGAAITKRDGLAVTGAGLIDNAHNAAHGSFSLCYRLLKLELIYTLLLHYTPKAPAGSAICQAKAKQAAYSGAFAEGPA
jgi:hypothetical protein